MATAQMIILVEWTWRSLIFNNGSMYGVNFGLQKWSLRQILKEDSAKYWPNFDYENWTSRLSLPLSFRTEQAPNFQEPHCKPPASIWYSVDWMSVMQFFKKRLKFCQCEPVLFLPRVKAVTTLGWPPLVLFNCFSYAYKRGKIFMYTKMKLNRLLVAVCERAVNPLTRLRLCSFLHLPGLRSVAVEDLVGSDQV